MYQVKKNRRHGWCLWNSVYRTVCNPFICVSISDVKIGVCVCVTECMHSDLFAYMRDHFCFILSTLHLLGKFMSYNL